MSEAPCLLILVSGGWKSRKTGSCSEQADPYLTPVYGREKALRRGWGWWGSGDKVSVLVLRISSLPLSRRGSLAHSVRGPPS